MGVDLGKLCNEQTIFTWVVKSDLLNGVKLKHVLTMGDKSPGIRACLHGGGGPQVGEVTRLGGVTRLSI